MDRFPGVVVIPVGALNNVTVEIYIEDVWSPRIAVIDGNLIESDGLLPVRSFRLI